MLIEDIRIECIDGDRTEVGATFNGQRFHYRIPASRLCREAVGDVLILSTLAPAAFAGITVEIPEEYPVSSQLLTNLDAIQRVWTSWNPRFKKVEVVASQYQPQASDGGVGLFYAGGVDSSYSLSTLLDEVDTLICCYGFDFAFTADEIRESIERNGRIADQLGKNLVAVETSHSAFVMSLGISRQFVFGLTLSCVGLLMGFRYCHIASSLSLNNLRPNGSHPCLDVLFSNGITEIVHDDVSVTRLEKTLAVARHPVMLDNLRVCWNFHDRNCGYCSKCLRTMAALRVAGVEGPFPKVESLKKFRQMAAVTEALFVVELILAAHKKGDRELLRELKKGLRFNDRRAAMQYIDRAFFGGRLRSLYRYFVHAPSSELIKWDLRPDLEIS